MISRLMKANSYQLVYLFKAAESKQFKVSALWCRVKAFDVLWQQGLKVISKALYNISRLNEASKAAYFDGIQESNVF